MTIAYTDEARDDVRNIALWYRDKREGLDDDFLLNLEVSVKAIERNPLFFRKNFFSIRSALLKRFPHRIYFTIVNEDHIQILGVLHTRRDIQTLLKRFKNED